MQVLSCPLCHGEVAPGSSGCRACRLPMSDVVRHGGSGSTSRARSAARAVRVRITGLVLYTAAVVWCAYQLPTTLPFVAPAAVLGGGLLHVWKGRPWLGLALFTLIVVAVPVFVLPALSTGALADLTDGF